MPALHSTAVVSCGVLAVEAARSNCCLHLNIVWWWRGVAWLVMSDRARRMSRTVVVDGW